MSEMVERVARALCRQQCFRVEVFDQPCIAPDLRNGPCEATADQLVLSWRWGCARAVIEAMRKPSETMIIAGVRAQTDDPNSVIETAWRAMIDAAVAD